MLKRLMPLLVVLGAMIYFLQVSTDRRWEELDIDQKRPFHAPNPAIVKIAAMGYHTMVADIYWLEAIQYYSESVTQDFVPNDLYHLTDFITDLDPNFCMAYYFGGQNMMVGDVDPRKVVEILEKGKKHCPQDYRPPFLLGYCYFFYLHEPDKSADNMELAAKKRDLPYLALLASRIRSESGRLETGVSFLEEMIRQTKDERARENYRQRIAEIRAKQQENRLNEVVENFRSAKGRYPENMDELVEAGFLNQRPVHPLSEFNKRYAFVYDKEESRIESRPPVYLKVYKKPKKKKK